MKKILCLTLIILLACVASYAQKISPPLVVYPLNVTPLYRDATSFGELLASVTSGLSGDALVARITYDVKRNKCKVILKGTKCLMTARYQGACVVYVDPNVISYEENNGSPWYCFVDAFKSEEKIYTRPDISTNQEKFSIKGEDPIPPADSAKIFELVFQCHEDVKKFKAEVVLIVTNNPSGLTKSDKDTISKRSKIIKAQVVNIINTVKESGLVSGSEIEKVLRVKVIEMSTQLEDVLKLVTSVKSII